MDPNANLREQRELAQQILRQTNCADIQRQAARLAELVEALDGWIKNGNFLPDGWKRRE